MVAYGGGTLPEIGAVGQVSAGAMPRCLHQPTTVTVSTLPRPQPHCTTAPAAVVLISIPAAHFFLVVASSADGCEHTSEKHLKTGLLMPYTTGTTH